MQMMMIMMTMSTYHAGVCCLSAIVSELFALALLQRNPLVR